MTSDQPVRCWLVERTYDDRGLVTLTYATLDGDRSIVKQRSEHLLDDRPTTAAIEVDPESLSPVHDQDERDRYATEAKRMADRHAPEDTI